MIPKTEIILGVDPGFGRAGFGILEKTKSGCQVLSYGCIDTSPKKEFGERLLEVSEGMNYLIKKYKPQRMAVEKLFFSKNITTAIQVAEARGVVILAATTFGLRVEEFTPPQIKQAITGYGKAEKKQMQKMVAMILGIKEKIKSDDAADALAVALCALQSGWKNKLK